MRKAWSTLADCVGPDGKLTHVQPIGAAPKQFPADAPEVYRVGPSFSPEAQSIG